MPKHIGQHTQVCNAHQHALAPRTTSNYVLMHGMLFQGHCMLLNCRGKELVVNSTHTPSHARIAQVRRLAQLHLQ